jgi:hypothetical protein
MNEKGPERPGPEGRLIMHTLPTGEILVNLFANIQRRIEARIGQLLGEGRRGDNQHSVTTESSTIQKDDRQDFRILGRALSGECAVAGRLVAA